MRISRSGGGKTYQYVYSGSQLRQLKVNGVPLVFYYGADGLPYAVHYGNASYFYQLNLQGDVIGIATYEGVQVVAYTYDAWGNILSTTGSMASTLGTLNPLRYRSYVYDSETGLYYLQSRYYNPQWGRFINADDPAYLGADGTLTSYNLYAYCGNNPVMGYDPTGAVDWGGVIIGAVIVVVGVTVTVASALGEKAIGIEVGVAAICTGAAMIDAAARETSMVIDLSVSIPVFVAYVKLGESFIIDFSANEVNSYHHLGGGVGANSGLSYSVGKPENYENPSDYSKGFIDVNGGYGVGVDHCWGPKKPYDSTTKASSISFSFPVSSSLGVGYDYYSEPSRLFGW